MFAKGNELITERKNLTEAVEHLHTQSTLFNYLKQADQNNVYHLHMNYGIKIQGDS